MIELNASRARQAIVEHTRRLADAAVAAGPDAAVPTAPEWTVAELVAHVGQTLHWVADIVERRVADFADLPTEMADVPADPGEWPAWLAEAARRVVTACSDDALDAPVLNAAGDERTGTEFWLTSMLNETVVHGADAAAAADAAGGPADAAAGVDADVAATLIGNHLAMLTSPTWEARRPESAHAIRGSGETLRWQATDIADGTSAWLVDRRPDGATWRTETGTPDRAERADVTTTGPAGALLLVLTRRLPLADAPGVTVDGDADLVRHWIDSTAHVAD